MKEIVVPASCEEDQEVHYHAISDIERATEKNAEGIPRRQQLTCLFHSVTAMKSVRSAVAAKDSWAKRYLDSYESMIIIWQSNQACSIWRKSHEILLSGSPFPKRTQQKNANSKILKENTKNSPNLSRTKRRNKEDIWKMKMRWTSVRPSIQQKSTLKHQIGLKSPESFRIHPINVTASV